MFIVPPGLEDNNADLNETFDFGYTQPFGTSKQNLLGYLDGFVHTLR